MDLGGFIGRFHPLLVHLPIGLLILAAILEYLARKSNPETRPSKYQQAISVILFLGALSAIASSVSGWLLANRGSYIEQSLFLHRWLGIGVAIFASLCWLIKTKRLPLNTGVFKSLLTIMVLGVFAAGHYGGKMTHGDDYLLEYAPAFIKNIFGSKKAAVSSLPFEKPESVKIYQDLLLPVFESHCWKCHNPDNPLGDLNMTTKTAFLKGGLNGAILEKGAAYQSELFNRITLPVSDKEAMPPVGLSLSYNKIRLIEWWINTGASFEKKLGELDVPSDIKNLLTEEYGISFIKKSAIESIEVVAATEAAISQVKQYGFTVNQIAENNNLLDLELKGVGEEIPKENLESLLKIKDQITWLTLSNSGIGEEEMLVIAQFKNLTRLRLNSNPITNAGLQKIESLPFLESLNLVDTKISNKALESIKKMPTLKTVFLWQTAVSETAMDELQNERPDLEITRGFQFDEPEKNKK